MDYEFDVKLKISSPDHIDRVRQMISEWGNPDLLCEGMLSNDLLVEYVVVTSEVTSAKTN